jgi:hypothetical protein
MTPARLPFVYFVKPIGLDGPIKIGCSFTPEGRLSALMTWSPWPLEIIATVRGDRDLEKNIHECFAHSHSHREWFRSTPELRAAIAKIAGGAPVAEAIDLTARHGTILSLARLKRDWTPERRAYTKMNHQLRAAEHRAAKRRGVERLHIPADADAIMRRWWGSFGDYGPPPTEKEARRLADIVARPEALCVTANERWPDDVIEEDAA